MSARVRALRALSLLAAGLAIGAVARADEPAPAPAAPRAEPAAPSAEAAARLTEGQGKLQKGDVAGACASFDASVALERAFAGLLAAAQCHELEGKTATAWRLASEASASATASAEQQDRARELASKLAPRLSKLRVDVLGPIEGETVLRDQRPIPREEWGVLVPVDPGVYTVAAAAPGRAPFSQRVEVGASADRAVIVVPALPLPGAKTAGDKGGGAKDGAGRDGAGKGAASEENPVIRDVSPLGVAAFVTTTGGIVGVAMGITFGVMTLNEVADAEDDPALCPNKVCSVAGRAAIDEAEAKGIGSTIGFTVGGAALATGVVLFVYQALSSDDAESGDKPKAAVRVEPAAMGPAVGVRVRF